MTRKRHLWISVSMIAIGLLGLLGLPLVQAFDRGWLVPRELNGGYGSRMGANYGSGWRWSGMMGSWDQGSVQSFTLAQVSHAMGSMASGTFTADNAGTFYYLCQYPGHAAEGMYGKLVVS